MCVCTQRISLQEKITSIKRLKISVRKCSFKEEKFIFKGWKTKFPYKIKTWKKLSLHNQYRKHVYLRRKNSYLGFERNYLFKIKKKKQRFINYYYIVPLCFSFFPYLLHFVLVFLPLFSMKEPLRSRMALKDLWWVRESRERRKKRDFVLAFWSFVIFNGKNCHAHSRMSLKDISMVRERRERQMEKFCFGLLVRPYFQWKNGLEGLVLEARKGRERVG